MAENTEVGKVLYGPQDRDAIHVAVASVYSDHRLLPGQRVGLVRSLHDKVEPDEYEYSTIGIVDPFLKNPVEPGTWFWVFLFPQTITSLKHNWTHPAFDKKPRSADDDIPDEVAPKDGKEAHRAWIAGFAGRVGLTYGDLMDATKDWLEHEDYLNRGDLLDGEWVPDTFWDHYEALMGIKVPDERRHNFFSCSC